MPKSTPPRLTLDYSNLRRHRRHAEMSQTELAAKAGMSVYTMARIEKGTADPSLPQMVAMARALGARIHELFTITAEHAA